MHATGAPQLALTSQVCTPLPEHCRLPGVHDPVHAPDTQLWLHAAIVPQVPVAPQVCTPLPEHWVVPGTHTPVHVAIEHA